MAFNTRQVGRTNLKVTELGLGGATLGGNMEKVADDAGRRIVDTAYDAGIRYFDTAPYYGHGRSEHVMGDALRSRKDYVLSTKVGRLLKPVPDLSKMPDFGWQNPFPFEPVFDYSYDAIMRTYEDSLQRLGLAHIDILFIHDVDVYLADSGPAEFEKAVSGAYRALDELRRNGDVTAIGMGVNEAKPIADALPLGTWDVFLLAGRYTLLEQAPLQTLFPDLEKHGASIVIGGPFNSGVLAGRETWNYAKAPPDVMERVAGLKRVADAHKVPLAAAALQFVLAHPLICSVIPGPRSADEFKQILEWHGMSLPAALWNDLKSEGLVEADAPIPG